MTRSELALMLDRLDPGAVLDVPSERLADVFPEVASPGEPSPEVERFAEEHRCTFCPAMAADAPRFIKSDVY